METVHDKDNLELNLQVGGLSRDLAMSTMLGMTVLTPLPFPSTLATRRGILYLQRGEVCNWLCCYHKEVHSIWFITAGVK